jgi:hypothetical protein
MGLERPQRMDVQHVDDEAVALAQRRRRRLRQEQGGFQITAQEIVPLGRRDRADRRGIEAGRIVDQHIEPAEGRERRRHQPRARVDVEQIRGLHGRRTGALGVQFRGQVRGGGGGGTVMHQDVGAGAVQRPGHGSAHAPCASGDQHRLAVERRSPDTGAHAKQRYRNVRAA